MALSERDHVLARLRELVHGDPESGHMEADRLLLVLIDDAEITQAFEEIPKWYA